MRYMPRIPDLQLTLFVVLVLVALAVAGCGGKGY
jgi:predicted small lipoprotein YifL